jgi:hypothetical protein
LLEAELDRAAPVKIEPAHAETLPAGGAPESSARDAQTLAATVDASPAPRGRSRRAWLGAAIALAVALAIVGVISLGSSDSDHSAPGAESASPTRAKPQDPMATQTPEITPSNPATSTNVVPSQTEVHRAAARSAAPRPPAAKTVAHSPAPVKTAPPATPPSAKQPAAAPTIAPTKEPSIDDPLGDRK